IAPFVLSTEPGGKGIPFSGHYRAMGIYTLTDPDPPPAFLQASLRGPVGFSGGIGMTTTRNQPGAPYYAIDRDALTVDATKYSVEFAKFFVQGRRANAKVLFGAFRVGFGDRLTLDHTVRYAPPGIYADDIFYIPRYLVGSCPLSPGDLDDTPCDPT